MYEYTDSLASSAGRPREPSSRARDGVYNGDATARVADDGAEGLSAPAVVPWDDGRLDERIYADAPNYLTYQLNSKRYSVPYHPVARLRASQSSGVVLPYAMIANRNYVNDDGNRCNYWRAACVVDTRRGRVTCPIFRRRLLDGAVIKII